MARVVAFLLYLVGVVAFGLSYHRLKMALDPFSFVWIVAFYLIGVSSAATWIGRRVASLSSAERR